MMKTIVAVKINPRDNVVTLVGDASPGDGVRYMTPEGDREITVLDKVPFGHKVAASDIKAGEQVIKYNEAIGRASQAIRKGEHVHVHNVASAVQGGAT